MATSKREEERNEKIIRGLMKLPPNRRCINCNALGPQYVCTNFWTFVCMICSGIHREFTHRVKSVSMSKFTSQEVEALQNGGNQRAREIFLKDWDLQRQRVPNSSNVDKVREFIKAVYVDRKYAGGNNSEKPPSDMQSHNPGDNMRRASSYHSYSQSPPYDFQYEERVKRNQGGSHGRKPGFDRGIYERKAASFVYSPGSFSDHIYEDSFMNVGPTSRVSDYSVSSGGDPFTSGTQSPNFQKDGGLSNPNFNSEKDANTIPVPHPQRSVSTGSFGTLDRHSASFQSSNSYSASIDLFQPLSDSSTMSPNFENHQTSLSPSFSSNSHELSNKPPCDEGWATFDLPQPSASTTADTQSAFVSTLHSEGGDSSTNTNSMVTSQVGMEWANFEALETPSIVSNPWNEGVQNDHTCTNTLSGQPWEAFEEYDQHQSVKKEQGSGSQVFLPKLTSATNKDNDLENSEVTSSLPGFVVEFEKVVLSEGASFAPLASHVAGGSSFSSPIVPLMGEIAQAGQKPGNPFDIDSELEAHSAFLGVSTLQGVLPSMALPSYDESWFPSNPMAYQSGLSYMPVQVPSSQLPNIQAPGAVSGNPFA